MQEKRRNIVKVCKRKKQSQAMQEKGTESRYARAIVSGMPEKGRVI